MVKNTRHLGVRTTEALQDIGASMQLVQSTFVNDEEFYDLFNWERKRLGLKGWTKDQFVKAIIEPARKKALANQKQAMEDARVSALRKQQMHEQQDRQVKIKELEQKKRIKELETELLDREQVLAVLQNAIGVNIEKLTKKTEKK